VKRSVTARREKLESLQTLSNYIHSCLKTQNSVWIAQKEGRAKDNVDVTDTAVLKMLHMAGRKLGWDFQQSMHFLNIIPVSLSYEWDPCDIDKAKELSHVNQGLRYEKSHDEDFQSIVKGLRGYKGRVGVHFGAAIKLDSQSAEDWGRAIDHAIYQGYEIYPVNEFAASKLGETSVNAPSEKIQEIWNKRYGQESESIQKQLLQNYRQPYLVRQETIHDC